MTTRPGTAVIGVGNEFRRDDAAGPAVIHRLRERATVRPLLRGPFPALDLVECDGDPVRLIELWQGADLAVVVDAAHAHPASPGRVHRLELDSATPGRPSGTSSHGLGLGEAVELARVLDRLPRRLVVYAVEGADTELGVGLSAAVAAAVSEVADSVEAEVLRHLEAEHPEVTPRHIPAPDRRRGRP
ncbi:hydrogenase maturation protease [Streptomyces sp. NBC_00237]|uniref:hydrogenase maturation protease n=1 Tax=Streptomyces sp. NBC_00237 TaxID=2975687 RepID=UPI00224FAA2F|nr:hydrogenase maturation protease [Streptomyces sp. NBC_00237]MCX5205788.1 hydrogenase maturation protease [Streptomyces sp. NBC_00237]